MREGFTAVPNQVLNHYTRLGITGAEMLFIVHVWQFWWAEGEFPRPSPSTLAEQMGVDERTIRNYTASLEAKGYLTIRQHWGQSERAPTNVYDFSALLNAVARVARGDVSFRLAIDPRPGPATGRGRRKNGSAQRRKRSSGPRWKDVSVN